MERALLSSKNIEASKESHTPGTWVKCYKISLCDVGGAYSDQLLQVIVQRLLPLRDEARGEAAQLLLGREGGERRVRFSLEALVEVFERGVAARDHVDEALERDFHGIHRDGVVVCRLAVVDVGGEQAAFGREADYFGGEMNAAVIFGHGGSIGLGAVGLLFLF